MYFLGTPLFHKKGIWSSLTISLSSAGLLSLVHPTIKCIDMASVSLSFLLRVHHGGNKAVLVTWTHVHLELLFDFIFKSYLCVSRALGRCCVTAIFAIFSFIILHVCYICTTVSQQANGALEVFLSFKLGFFCLFCYILFHSLEHECIR